MLSAEFARHETALNLAATHHDAAIQVETRYHQLRTKELARIIDMLDERLTNRGEEQNDL